MRAGKRWKDWWTGCPATEAADRPTLLASASPIRIEIVRKPKGQVGLAVHARRWLVECFLAWIGGNRCLAKDFDAFAASIMLLLRRLGRCT